MDSKLRGNLSLLSRSVNKYTVSIMEIFTLEKKGFRRKLKRLLCTMKRCVVVTEVFRAILEAYMLEMKPTASRTGCAVHPVYIYIVSWVHILSGLCAWSRRDAYKPSSSKTDTDRIFY